eukprot:GHRR01012379.1.p1 GENE.GHRR01012379.1~~GHRR01012379.1.p1  ORF type:complete len:482 (+),score=159.42 GHRR01012379.1:198-1643(+)
MMKASQRNHTSSPCLASGRGGGKVFTRARPQQFTPQHELCMPCPPKAFRGYEWSASAADFKTTAPVAPKNASNNGLARTFDVLGCGQAMVDYAATVDECLLESLGVPKGGRRVITPNERARVMELLEDYDSKVSAGGSLANTLVGLSELAAAHERASKHMLLPSTGSCSSTGSSGSHRSYVRVAMTGPVIGQDALGDYARAQLQAAGVEVVGPSITDNPTGTVMVLATPDAQRSFLSCFSTDDSLQLSSALQATVSQARLLVVEGYLWELPGSHMAIPALIRHARACGAVVALTAGDASVIERHGSKVLDVIATGVDIWFGNAAEAAALVKYLQQHQDMQQQHLQQQYSAMLEDDEQDFTALHLQQLRASFGADSNSSSTSSSSNSTADITAHSNTAGSDATNVVLSAGQQAALQLASVCPLVVVTDGSRGSYITALGQLMVVPPYWSSNPPGLCTNNCASSSQQQLRFTTRFCSRAHAPS